MIDAINVLLAKEGIPAPARGGMMVHTEQIPQASGVAARVAAFGVAEGWICYTGGVEVLPAGTKVVIPPGSYIVSAELAAGQRSLHVRQQGRGWLVAEYTRTDEDSGIIVAETLRNRGSVTACDGNQVGVPGGLKYETFWQLAGNSAGDAAAYRPHLSRFAGFQAKGGK